MLKNTEQKLKKLFNEQRFAVIATQEKNEPYTNLVSFITEKDLKKIYFPTSKNSRKFKNLSRNSKISILIDNRKNNPKDVKNAMAVTAVGITKENNSLKILRQFLKKHPYLKKFVNSSNNIIIEIIVEKYIIVDNFQNVEIVNF